MMILQATTGDTVLKVVYMKVNVHYYVLISERRMSHIY